MVDRAKKVTELTAASNTGANSDLLVIVQNVGAASVETRKVNIPSLFQRHIDTIYNGNTAAGTIVPNRGNGAVQKFTLTANITINQITNMTGGQRMSLILTQDAAGNNIGTFGANFKFSDGSKTLSTAASATDIVDIFYDGTTYFSRLTKGYA